MDLLQLVCWSYLPFEHELAREVSGTFGTFGNVPKRGWNVPLGLVCWPAMKTKTGGVFVITGDPDGGSQPMPMRQEATASVSRLHTGRRSWDQRFDKRAACTSPEVVRGRSSTPRRIRWQTRQNTRQRAIESDSCARQTREPRSPRGSMEWRAGRRPPGPMGRSPHRARRRSESCCRQLASGEFDFRPMSPCVGRAEKAFTLRLCLIHHARPDVRLDGLGPPARNCDHQNKHHDYCDEDRDPSHVRQTTSGKDRLRLIASPG